MQGRVEQARRAPPHHHADAARLPHFSSVDFGALQAKFNTATWLRTARSVVRALQPRVVAAGAPLAALRHTRGTPLRGRLPLQHGAEADLVLLDLFLQARKQATAWRVADVVERTARPVAPPRQHADAGKPVPLSRPALPFGTAHHTRLLTSASLILSKGNSSITGLMPVSATKRSSSAMRAAHDAGGARARECTIGFLLLQAATRAAA